MPCKYWYPGTKWRHGKEGVDGSSPSEGPWWIALVGGGFGISGWCAEHWRHAGMETIWKPAAWFVAAEVAVPGCFWMFVVSARPRFATGHARQGSNRAVRMCIVRSPLDETDWSRTGAHRLGHHAGDRAAAQSRGDRVIGAVGITLRCVIGIVAVAGRLLANTIAAETSPGVAGRQRRSDGRLPGRECQAWTASRCSRSVVLRGIGLELHRIGHATFGRSQADDIGGPGPRRRVAHLRLTDVAGERIRIVGQVAVQVRGQGRPGGPRSHVPTQCDFRRRASSTRLRGASSRCCAR